MYQKIIVDATDIHFDIGVARSGPHEVEDAVLAQHGIQLRDQRRIRAEGDNVIEPRATGLLCLQCRQVQRGKRPGAHDRRARRLGLRFEAVGNRRRDIGEDHDARMRVCIQATADMQRVGHAGRSGPTNHPERAAVEEGRPMRGAVAGDHARPRLGERRLGIAGLRLHRQQIAALIAIDHLLGDDAKLLKGTRKLVAVGHIRALIVDIRLNDEAVARLELPAAVLTDGNHRHRGFVPEDHRVALHIAPQDARVLVPLHQNLDIAEAEAGGIHAHQQFIGPRLRHTHLDRLPLVAQVFQARSVQRPYQHRGWRRRWVLSILLQPIAHGNLP